MPELPGSWYPKERPLAHAKHEDRLHPAPWTQHFWLLRSLRKEIERIVHAHVATGGVERLLDYGCGNKPYQPLFQPHVSEYVGADIAPDVEPDLLLDEKGALACEDESVDVVLSVQVLEHVSDPAHYLAEARRVLRPGGQLILSTHGAWMFHQVPQDFWRWTTHGLRKVVVDAGFQVVRFRGLIGAPGYAIQILQDSLAVFLPVSCSRSGSWSARPRWPASTRCTPTACEGETPPSSCWSRTSPQLPQAAPRADRGLRRGVPSADAGSARSRLR